MEADGDDDDEDLHRRKMVSLTCHHHRMSERFHLVEVMMKNLATDFDLTFPFLSQFWLTLKNFEQGTFTSDRDESSMENGAKIFLSMIFTSTQKFMYCSHHKTFGKHSSLQHNSAFQFSSHKFSFINF